MGLLKTKMKLEMAISELNPAWQDLKERAIRELTNAGFPEKDITFQYEAEARYLGQMTSWSFPVAKGRVETTQDVESLIGGFEKT